jgi:chromosome segregation ATPase
MSRQVDKNVVSSFGGMGGAAPGASLSLEAAASNWPPTQASKAQGGRFEKSGLVTGREVVVYEKVVVDGKVVLAAFDGAGASASICKDKKLSKLQKKREKVADKLKCKQVALGNAKEAVESKNKEIDGVHAGMEKDFNDLGLQMYNLKTYNQTEYDDMSSRERDIESHKSRIADLESQLNSLKGTLNGKETGVNRKTVKRQYEETRDSLNKARASLNKAQTLHSEKCNKTFPSLRKFEEKRLRHEKLKGDLTGLRCEVYVLEEEVRKIQSEADDLEVKIEDRKNELRG